MKPLVQLRLGRRLFFFVRQDQIEDAVDVMRRFVPAHVLASSIAGPCAYITNGETSPDMRALNSIAS